MADPGEDRSDHKVGREDRGVPAGDLANREVEGHHGVDGDDQRRREGREEQVGHLVAVPVRVAATPAQGEDAVCDPADRVRGPVAQGRPVRAGIIPLYQNSVDTVA